MMTYKPTETLVIQGIIERKWYFWTGNFELLSNHQRHSIYKIVETPVLHNQKGIEYLREALVIIKTPRAPNP